MPYLRMVVKLKADSGVDAIVDGRIYPIERTPASALPAIVYTVLSDIPSNDANGTTSTKEMRIEVISLATTYPAARALAAAVETALSGWNDSSGSVWHLDSSMDTPGEVSAGEEIIAYHGVTQEYVIWY